MKSSVSIALFFLLSGFFLSSLLGALERSGKMLLASGACLAAVVCIIVFLAPVEWPAWHLGWGSDDGDASTSTVSRPTSGTPSATSSPATSSTTSSTTIRTTSTTGTSGATGTTIRITATTGAYSGTWH